MNALRGVAAACLSALAMSTTGLVLAAHPSNATTPFTSRVTARWATVTDTHGHRWTSGTTAMGVAGTMKSLDGKPIAGTDDDTLYQVNASGLKAYSLAVPSQGMYRVRLLMAEDWATRAGQRVFSVSAEGATTLPKVDIFAEAGKAVALDKTFDVPVTDGTLDLGFTAIADRPLISAIEVVGAGPLPTPTPTATPTATPTVTPTATPTAAPTPEPTPTPKPTDSPDGAEGGTSGQIFTSRITARSTPVLDSAGRTWAARPATLGTSAVARGLDGQPIAGTDDDVLYQIGAPGTPGYRLAVPAPATYRVRLLMAEPYWSKAGQRVFTVSAEGTRIGAPVDIYAAVGRGAAHDLTFDVPVRDGQLDLTFAKVVDQPVISAIEVVSTTPVASDPGALTGSGPAVAFGPGSFYTADLRTAPVASDSAALVADLRRQVVDNYNGVAAVNAYHYNVGFYRVGANQPKKRIGFWDCQSKGYVPNGLFDGAKHFVDVPVPDHAVPAVGTDAQLTIYDPAADKLWELWVVRKTSAGEWQACWGGRIDNVSSGQGVFAYPYGASAAGLSMAGGMIGIDEVERGSIDHAMYLAVINSRSGAFSWPANRTDGTSSSTSTVRHGQRLRLDPTVDVDSLHLSPMGAMIARAAQKHGFIVSDTAGAVSVITEAGTDRKRLTGVDPWDSLLGGPSYKVLEGFPWDRLQALPVDYGKR